MRKFTLAVLASLFCFTPAVVSPQGIIPNKTFFPDLEKEEVAFCKDQADAYAWIAKMRDSKVAKAEILKKLIDEIHMAPETAKRVVDSVYAFRASEEQIKGQIMGECITTLSYEKLIKQSKYI